jgi:hypothetical protein
MPSIYKVKELIIIRSSSFEEKLVIMVGIQCYGF